MSKVGAEDSGDDMHRRQPHCSREFTAHPAQELWRAGKAEGVLINHSFLADSEPAVMTPVYRHCTAEGPRVGRAEAADGYSRHLIPLVTKDQIFTGLPVRNFLFSHSS